MAAVGITNQRETLVVWDRATGKPLHNAIVWNDTRTQAICKRLERTLQPSLLAAATTSESKGDEGARSGASGQDALREVCGLPISTYFSAVKLIWLMENVPKVGSGGVGGLLTPRCRPRR